MKRKILNFLIILNLLSYFKLLADSKKVLMVISFENFRDEELLVPKDILEKNGLKVDIASTKKGIATGMLGAKVKVEMTINEVKIENYDGIIFVGGIGVEKLFDDPFALKLAQEFYEKKKIIGAICLAPGILANSGILKNKKATCFPSAKNILEKKGAIYTGKSIEVYENIITASGPEVVEKFGNEILKLLKKVSSK